MICDNDHNDRGKMSPVFKGDALVGWICSKCLNGHNKIDFERYLLINGFDCKLKVLSVDV